jgi:3-hydroxyisobutyrate dehydrogenase-like beta-hydroxyacid dehydrogenase
MATVALLGLGEAGSRLASDLAAAGLDVRGYDPDEACDAPGAVRAPDPRTAVAGSDVVLSVNSAAAALGVAAAALPALESDAVYADLNTAAPSLKREVAALVAGAGARFADVALLGPVPARGLRTPVLASGAGAGAFAHVFRPLGMPVEVVSAQAGDAAARKLLRSVFMKGLAAAAIESLEAAEAAGQAAWLERELAAVIGEPLLERLLQGSREHAARRVDEMEAARDLLLELGIEPRIAAASASLLAGLAAAGPSRGTERGGDRVRRVGSDEGAGDGSAAD